MKKKLKIKPDDAKATRNFRIEMANKQLAELNDNIGRDDYRRKILQGWLSGDSIFRTPVGDGRFSEWELHTEGTFNWDEFIYQTVPGKKPCCALDKDGDGQCPLHPDGIDPMDQDDEEESWLAKPVRKVRLRKALDQCEDEEP